MENALSLMEKAAMFASKAHEGQIHRDGKPAIQHAKRVAQRFADQPHLYVIAFLHDVLEDCPEVQFSHIDIAFGSAIACSVAALTRRSGESWSLYIQKVRTDPDAIAVKIADIEDNMARADEKFRKKIAMYEKALAELKSCHESGATPADGNDARG